MTFRQAIKEAEESYPALCRIFRTNRDYYLLSLLRNNVGKQPTEVDLAATDWSVSTKEASLFLGHVNRYDRVFIHRKGRIESW